MSIKPAQNQFNGGEISPYMDARFDLPTYQYAAAIMQNFIPVSEGCFKRRGGTRFVAAAKQTEAVLFKVMPTPADAVVTINGIIQNQCYVAPGDVVSYSVTAADYASQSGSYKVNENTNLEITLVSSVIQYQVSIAATPQDAVVTINGLQRSNALVGANSTVSWSVSQTGYYTQSGEIINISADADLNIALKMRFAIKATPQDAIILMNGVERNFIDVNYGESVIWSVSKEGYQAQGGTEIVTQSMEKVVNLSSQVPGQVMFESSTAGTYSLSLEDGLYDLLMCGRGGNAVRYSAKVGYRYNNGGSAAVWQGRLRLSKSVLKIVIGDNETASLFSNIITVGSGKNATAGANNDGDGGILTIHSVSEIVSEIIAANGQKNGGSSPVWAALPDEYKYSYGYGGYKTAGGPAYVKLVYLGRE